MRALGLQQAQRGKTPTHASLKQTRMMRMTISEVSRCGAYSGILYEDPAQFNCLAGRHMLVSTAELISIYFAIYYLPEFAYLLLIMAGM